MKRTMFCLLILAASRAWGAHPLITEDTGTQGKGGWQLELNGERNKDAGVRGSAGAATLSYGAVDNVDLQLTATYQDIGMANGRGDSAIDVKWRFWESGALSLGLKPGITLPTGKDERGLGTGKTTYGSLFIISYEPELWSFHTHAGYRHNRNTQDQRKSLKHWSASLWLKPTDKLKLVSDFSRDTNPDPSSDTAVRQRVLGAIYSFSKTFDADVGVRRGNAPAIDRAVMAGITVRW
jgi:hypothetical protein